MKTRQRFGLAALVMFGIIFIHSDLVYNEIGNAPLMMVLFFIIMCAGFVMLVAD